MNFWKAIYRFSFLTVAIFLFVALLAMFVPQYKEYQANQHREQDLQIKIRRENELLKSLKEKQERFKADPRFIKQIANEMGMATPEETIFKFVNEEEPAPRP